MQAGRPASRPLLKFAYKLKCIAYSIISIYMAKTSIRSGWILCVIDRQKLQSFVGSLAWKPDWQAITNQFVAGYRNFESMLVPDTGSTTPSLIAPSFCWPAGEANNRKITTSPRLLKCCATGRQEMTKAYRSHDDATAAMFRHDPAL